MSTKKILGLSGGALAVLASGYAYVIDQSSQKMEAAFSDSVEDISKGLAAAFPEAHFGLLKVDYTNTGFTESEAKTLWGDVNSGRALLILNHHIQHGLISSIETLPEMRQGSQLYRAIPDGAVDKTQPLFTIHTQIANLTGRSESHIQSQAFNLSQAESGKL